MLHILRLIILICLVVVCCSKEELHHSGHFSSNDHITNEYHDFHHDHEAIFGSAADERSFDKLSPAEARLRLSPIVDKIDLNGDGYINQEELTAWVMKSFKSLDDEEALGKLKSQDKNNDGRVSWSEYVLGAYGYSPDEILIATKDSTEAEVLPEMLEDDILKFKTADLNHDGFLDRGEYPAFVHPHDYSHMHKQEVDREMARIDKNQDGYISFEEFSKNVRDQEARIQDKEEFLFFDSDHDGKLSRDEFKVWLLPDNRDSAELEAQHLIRETDADKDGLLTKSEILARTDLWGGSQALENELHDEL